MTDYTVETIDSILAVERDAWNRLAGIRHPFLRHEFLKLETEGMQDYLEEMRSHSPYRTGNRE